MGDGAVGWIVPGFIGLIASVFIANLASGGRDTYGWGLLGPLGWIIAGQRGVQMRLDETISKPQPPMVAAPTL